MLVRSADLRALSAKTADGRSHAITDLLTDHDGIALDGVVVDFKGWLDLRHAGIGIGRFDTPDLESRTWPVRVTSAEIEARETTDESPSLADRIGSEVTGSDGRLGTLLDVVYETDTWRPAFLVVQLGDGLPTDQKVIPAGALAAGNWPRGSVRLDISEADARESPSFHEESAISGTWLRNVLAYYGIPT